MARELSWLERQPVTLEVDGSSPFRVAILFSACFNLKNEYASVAQSVEHETENLSVGGSIPPRGTKNAGVAQW